MIPEEAFFLAIAQACHEANRSYCAVYGDDSQKPWEQAPQWQKDSAVAGVVGVVVKGNGPEQSHESWLAHKKADGWVYGDVKDPEKKTHPCMLPYAELPEEQKRKDAIFVGVATSMAAAFGLVMGPGRGNSAFSNG